MIRLMEWADVRTVLITGGSGFLGRGILRVAEGLGWDCIVYSRDEYKQDLCKRKYPNARYVLGDIKDYDRLKYILELGRVDTVVHTAAIKYIPEAEYNVAECIDVNVWGSEVVLRAALSGGVENVVMISTDKACQPINVYGASKMLMERLACEYARLANGKLKIGLARYGNVIGSTGSVIPKFVEAQRAGQRIQVTDPNMTRYWITIDEAIDLIVLALGSVWTGSIVIPKPAAMRMGDLAATIAGEWTNIDVVGVRPGEKMHEQLLHKQESVRAVDCGSHYELLPMGAGGAGGAGREFELVSNHPDSWLTPEKLLESIEIAALV